jgi:hypothetical protein
VTPLNTKAMSLVFIVLSTSEVTSRDLNSAVSDVRGPLALPPLSEWMKHSCGCFKCHTDTALAINASFMPVTRHNENRLLSCVITAVCRLCTIEKFVDLYGSDN